MISDRKRDNAGVCLGRSWTHDTTPSTYYGFRLLGNVRIVTLGFRKDYPYGRSRGLDPRIEGKVPLGPIAFGDSSPRYLYRTTYHAPTTYGPISQVATAASAHHSKNSVLSHMGFVPAFSGSVASCVQSYSRSLRRRWKSGATGCPTVQSIAPLFRQSMFAQRAASGLTKQPSVGLLLQAFSRAWRNTGLLATAFRTPAVSRSFVC